MMLPKLNLLGKGSGWDKYTYVFLLFLAETAFGMASALYSPIMVDMKYILDTSIKWISLYTTFETAGYILGTLVGLLYKYLNRQLVLATLFLLLTVASAVIPLSPNIWLLYVCAFVIGFSSSVYISSSTVWIFELSRGTKIPMIQIFSFWFGIGEIITTDTLKPFLTGEIKQARNQTIFDTSLTEDHFLVEEVIDRRARLMRPIMLLGASIIFIPVAIVIMYFLKPYKEPEKKQEEIDVSMLKVKLFDRKESPRRIIRLLFALWFATDLVMGTVFLKFAVTYIQYSPLSLSAEKATEIFSYAITLFSAGLGLNILYSYKIKINYILLFHYSLEITGFALLIPARESELCLWVAILMIGYGLSANFTGILSFTEMNLNMTNNLSTVYLLLRGVLTLVSPFILGNYIENYSLVFLYVEYFYLVFALIMFATIHLIIKRYTHLINNTASNLNPRAFESAHVEPVVQMIPDPKYPHCDEEFFHTKDTSL